VESTSGVATPFILVPKAGTEVEGAKALAEAARRAVYFLVCSILISHSYDVLNKEREMSSEFSIHIEEKGNK